jgi:hypothetical protein
MKGNHEGRIWRETLRAEATAVSAGSAIAGSGVGTARAVTTPRAWDPYEVWLNRVKLPRDRRAATQSR